MAEPSAYQVGPSHGGRKSLRELSSTVTTKISVVSVASIWLLFSLALVTAAQSLAIMQWDTTEGNRSYSSIQTSSVIGYFALHACFLVAYGQLLVRVDPKWTYLMAISAFEFGTLLCALSENEQLFITGRALSSSGNAGVVITVLLMISRLARLEAPPLFLGFLGAGLVVYGSSRAYVLNGFIHRWAFVLNLAFVLASFVVVFGFITGQSATPSSPTNSGARQTILDRYRKTFDVGLAGVHQDTLVIVQHEWSNDQFNRAPAPSLLSLAFCTGGVLGLLLIGFTFVMQMRNEFAFYSAYLSDITGELQSSASAFSAHCFTLGTDSVWSPSLAVGGLVGVFVGAASTWVLLKVQE